MLLTLFLLAAPSLPEIVIEPGLRDRISVLDLSADGRYLVTIDDSLQATLWDTAAQRSVRRQPIAAKKEQPFFIGRLLSDAPAVLTNDKAPWIKVRESGAWASQDRATAFSEYLGFEDWQTDTSIEAALGDAHKAGYPCSTVNRVQVRNARDRVLFSCQDPKTRATTLAVADPRGAVLWRSEPLSPMDAMNAGFSADGEHVHYFVEKQLRLKKVHLGSKRVVEHAVTSRPVGIVLSKSGKSFWYTVVIDDKRSSLTRLDADTLQPTLRAESPLFAISVATDTFAAGITRPLSQGARGTMRALVFDGDDKRVSWILPSSSGTIRALGFAGEDHLIIDTAATRRVFSFGEARVGRSYTGYGSVYLPGNFRDFRFTHDFYGAAWGTARSWTIRSTADGRVVARFNSAAQGAVDVESSERGKLLLVTEESADRKRTIVSAVDVDSGRARWVKTLDGAARGVVDPGDETVTLQIANGSALIVLRASDGAELTRLSGDGGSFVRGDGKSFAFTRVLTGRARLELADVATRKPAGTLSLDRPVSEITPQGIPGSSDVLVTISNGNDTYTVQRHSPNLAQKRWSTNVPAKAMGALVVTGPTLALFVTGDDKGELHYPVDLASGRLGKALRSEAVYPSPDGRTLVAQSKGDVSVQVAGGAPKLLLSGVTERCFAGYSATLIAVGCGQTATVFDRKTLKKKLVLTNLDEDRLIARLPDGPYFASAAAVQALRYNEGGRSYDFESLDVFMNRPDEVLAALGRAPAGLLEVYKKARQKRLAQLGIDPAASPRDRPSVSVAVASGDTPITDGTVTDAATVRVTLRTTAKAPLSSLSIAVNGVPLPVAPLEPNAQTLSLERAIDVALGHGRNVIAVSATDRAGRESLRAEALVIRRGAATPTLHVVTIGVSRHQQADFDLDYAAKDARDLAAALGTSPAFTKVVPHVITDAEVTRESVAALATRFADSTPDDAIVVFYAGHGVLDDELDYWLATHDMRFDKPAERGLSYAALEALFRNAPARRRLLLLDACHSGEIEKDEVTLAPIALGSQLPPSDPAVKVRGLKKLSVTAPLSAIRRELFLDARPSNGAVVLTSASGAERAIESGALKNGLFTYALIEGLSGRADDDGDGALTTAELLAFTQARVSALSGGAQTPSARRAARRFDFPLTVTRP